MIEFKNIKTNFFLGSLNKQFILYNIVFGKTKNGYYARFITFDNTTDDVINHFKIQFKLRKNDLSF